MVRRLVAMALPSLLVSGCAGFSFSTDHYEPGTVVGQTSAVVTNGRIPYNGAFIGTDLPDGTVIPMNNMVDKHGRKYEELDLAEMDQNGKEIASALMRQPAGHREIAR